MTHTYDHRTPKRYLFSILLPTILTLAFLISIIYGVVIPAFERNFLEGKKSTIEQLTSVAMDIMVYYDDMVQNEEIDITKAKKMALSEIESLRYGATKQDYFWVCDLQPKMVMHPYSKEMVGTDLENYRDSSGTKIFLKFIELVKNQQSGFLYHSWHTKYEDQTVVAKLTYVTKFDSWEWIIGTGVYLDDVKTKTDQIYAHLSKIAFGVVVVVALLFFYLARQSLINERKRFQAESELIQSREKYKTLVESATEPMMMFFENHCIYSNSSINRLLGTSTGDLESSSISSLFPELPSSPLDQLFASSNTGKGLETAIVKLDGSPVQVRLTFTERLLGDKKVQLITVRDMSSRRKIEEELGVSHQRYQWLINQLHIGIFRTSSTDGFSLLEANPLALKLFGLAKDHIGQVELTDILENSFDAKHLLESLHKKHVIKDLVVPVRTTNGAPRVVSLSMVMATNTLDAPLYCDGIVEDITLQQVRVGERDDLFTEMQSSMTFLNGPVKDIIRKNVSYNFKITVEDALKVMHKTKNNALLLTDDTERVVGLFGNSEIRTMLMTGHLSADTPTRDFMGEAINIIEETTPVFEAVLLMGEQETEYLCVKDSQGAIIGIICDKELLQVHRYSPTFLLREIQDSRTLDDIVSCHTKMFSIVKALTDSGTNAKTITRIITSIADAVFERIMEFSLEELGAPPVAFVVIGLGSEGRGEQTLATDQDNAIIFKDVPSDQFEFVQNYFLELGRLICLSLDKVGYVLCKGEIMAMNPRWCNPLSVWKEYFSTWIANSTPQDLMELNIFFDYRSLYGDSDFVDEIRGHVQNSLRNRPVFFHLMAENNLLFKIPLDFFGNISVETEGEHANCFNIKHVLAMVVGFARIHGVKHSLETSNTLERLEILYDIGALTKEAHDGLVDSYDFLMQMRFRHQVQKIDRGEKPDNWVNLSELTNMEKDLLKKIFAKVATLRKKLTGKAESNIFF